MRIGSVFSGIGGLEKGIEMSGLGHTVWQVERSAFCQSVLKRHWPNAERFDDVCSVGSSTLAPVDLICGGFPCQDLSSAGKGIGLTGKRSGLWFEYLRIISELKPEWVVVENVASGAKKWLDRIRADLGEQDYETLPVPLSAFDVGAPHLRKRIFVIAHSNGVEFRQQSRRGAGESWQDSLQSAWASQTWVAGHADSYSEPAVSIDGKVAGLQSLASDSSHWATPPEFRGVDDGVSLRLDAARNRALGNAVTIQCAEVIGHIVLELTHILRRNGGW